jgi:uncharacterized cupredoxin-like copper-binding protein
MSRWRRLLHARAACCAALVAVLPVCAALAVSGCSGTEGGVAEAGGRVVKATIGEKADKYVIELDKSSVSAGQIRFEIKNTGKIEHEFVVMKTASAPDALPVADGEVSEDDVISSEADIVEAEDIGPGTSTVLEANLKAGTYVVICNLTGHYEHGMRAGLRVG